MDELHARCFDAKTRTRWSCGRVAAKREQARRYRGGVGVLTVPISCPGRQYKYVFTFATTCGGKRCCRMCRSIVILASRGVRGDSHEHFKLFVIRISVGTWSAAQSAPHEFRTCVSTLFLHTRSTTRGPLTLYLRSDSPCD